MKGGEDNLEISKQKRGPGRVHGAKKLVPHWTVYKREKSSFYDDHPLSNLCIYFSNSQKPQLRRSCSLPQLLSYLMRTEFISTYRKEQM